MTVCPRGQPAIPSRIGGSFHRRWALRSLRWEFPGSFSGEKPFAGTCQRPSMANDGSFWQPTGSRWQLSPATVVATTRKEGQAMNRSGTRKNETKQGRLVMQRTTVGIGLVALALAAALTPGQT